MIEKKQERICADQERDLVQKKKKIKTKLIQKVRHRKIYN